MDIREMRMRLGDTQSEFAARYHIPFRTVQNWETGLRKPPEYIMELLESRKDKSLMSELSYVECPYCGKRHYRNEIIAVEGVQIEKSHVQPVARPSEDTARTEPKGVTFAAIGNMLK